MDEVLALDDSVRYVGIMDAVENTLMSRMKKNKISLKSRKEEDDFAMEIKKLKHGQDEFNSPLGKISFFQIRRQKIIYIIFFIGNLIIYFSCEPTITNHRASQIIDKALSIVDGYLAPQHLQEAILP